MNRELLDQAYSLYTSLSKQCWNASYKQDVNLYARLKPVESKALDRYERRFTKYKAHTETRSVNHNQGASV
jgi:hypothetical protein